MKRISVLSFIFLIMLSTNVFAANWEYIGNDTNGSQYYIEPSSITKTKCTKDELRFTVYSKTEYSELGRHGLIEQFGKYSDYIQYAAYSIDQYEYRLHRDEQPDVGYRCNSCVYYDAAGNPVYQSDGWRSFEKLKPNMMAATIFRSAWSYLFPAK